MIFALKRFYNRLKRFRALPAALRATLFAIVAQAQQTSTTHKNAVHASRARPNSDFFIIYNQSTGEGLECPSYSLQIKLTRDFTF